MHAFLALALALAAPALAARLGHEREIDTSYNQAPKLLDFVLNQDYLSAQRNRAKLVTKLRPDDALAADNVILQSNVVTIVRPERKGELVRRRRGYNLEHVRVPARYPYLPVPQYRFRRWG